MDFYWMDIHAMLPRQKFCAQFLPRRKLRLMLRSNSPLKIPKSLSVYPVDVPAVAAEKYFLATLKDAMRAVVSSTNVMMIKKK